jgi:ketosteroid isomerase-like protein
MNRMLAFLLWSIAFFVTLGTSAESMAGDATTPESAIRTIVRANAEKDMVTLSRLMAHDADSTNYTIGARKYVGWPDLERDFIEEFSAVNKLELPIHELKVWANGNVAWFTMELDYIRYLGAGTSQQKQVLQLRETGVLEKRKGQWILVSWHESPRTAPLASPAQASTVSDKKPGLSTPDLSGEWDITETDNDKHYKATLDKAGNGPYTQHGGRFVTTKFADRLWQGTWQQPGNDREGGFELLLSEDGLQAKGIWWYTRVGSQKNIPPREHGGTYEWKRLTPLPPSP